MSDRYFGIGFESTFNEAAAISDYLELVRLDSRTVRTFIDVDSIRSVSLRDVKEAVELVEWEAEVRANFQDMPLLTYALLGGSTPTGGGPYTHTQPGTGGIVERPSLTLEHKEDSNTLTFRDIGALVERLAFSSVRDGLVEVTMGGIATRQIAPNSYTGTHDGGADAATFSDASAVFPLNAFVGWTVNNTTDGSSGTVTANTGTSVTATLSGGTDDDWDDGDAMTLTPPTDTYPDFDLAAGSDLTVNVDAVDAEAQQINLNINYPVDRPWALGSTVFSRKPEATGVISIEGDFVSFFDDLTLFNKYDGSSDVDVQLNLSDGTHSLTINLDKTRVIDHQKAIEGRARALETLRFKALSSGVTATDPIQVIGINDQATVP